MFRLRGKGVKSVRSHSHGDLMCRVVVETPVNLTARQRELLKDFEATFKARKARDIRRARTVSLMASSRSGTG